ncbi:MAG: hypothetical protein MK033_01840 [Candidatus Caenarcaniphilales bacterium]|nr:hypothetical protein [Candidatus Caenarcaniphilales bacterium]
MSGSSLGAGGGFNNQFQQNNKGNLRLPNRGNADRAQKQVKAKGETATQQKQSTQSQEDSFQNQLEQKVSLRDSKQKINFDLRKQVNSKRKKQSSEQARLTQDPGAAEKPELASLLPRVRRTLQQQNKQNKSKVQNQKQQDAKNPTEGAETNQSLAKDLGQSEQSVEKYRAFHKQNTPKTKQGRTSKVKNLLAQKKKQNQDKAQEALYAKGKKLPIQGLGLGKSVTQARYTKGYINSLSQQAKGEEAFRVAKGLIGITNNTDKTEHDLLLSEANFSPFKFNAIAALRQKYLNKLKTKKKEKVKPPTMKAKEKGASVGEAVYQFLVEILEIELPWDLKIS